MIRQILFDQGETRHVQLLIKNIKGKDFKIESAIWELKEKYGKQIEEGTCNIDNHMIDAVISPQQAGYYLLKFTYKIQDETLVDVIEVRVE